MMWYPVALALLAAAPAPDTVWGSIRGTVQSEPTGVPIAMAIVEVQSGGRQILATADSAGSYLLARVPAGRQVMRVRHLDHEPVQMEVLVPPKGQVALDVWLRHRPIPIAPVTAQSGAHPLGEDSVAASAGATAITDFTTMDGGGVGAGLPSSGAGTSAPPPGEGETGDVLFVRGSAADLKLVLLDGAPVYAPFHMGGLVEGFEPGLLSGARLYLGGAPARYDGGISYVLDLTTRSAHADRQHAQAALDMVSARGTVEGPLLWGATYLLGARVVHGASLARLEDEPFPYRFADGLARVNVPLGGDASLSLTGFINGEAVRLDTLTLHQNFARWSNQAVSARLRGPVLGSQAQVTLAFSHFDARLPQGGNQRTPELLFFRANTRRARLAVDFTREAGEVRLSYGYGYDRQWVRHRARERAVARRELLDTESSGTVAGGYLDANWAPSSRWVVRGGVRGDLFSIGSFATFSPRASVTWLATERSALTLAGGRYHQYLRVRNRFPFEIGVPSVADSLGLATNLAVAGANHLSLALDQELAEGVRLGVETYHKRFEDIPEEVDAYTSGVDVWVRRSTGVVTGWLGYSLARSWSRPDSAGAAARGSRRQILSAGLGGRMGPAGRFDMRMAWGKGLPYTSVGVELDPNSAPGTPGQVETGNGTDGADVTDGVPLNPLTREPFLRLDAQVSRTFTPVVAGRQTQLTPYLRVLNALDRRDALFYRYNPKEGNPKAVGTLPFLPVFGVDWKF